MIELGSNAFESMRLLTKLFTEEYVKLMYPVTLTYLYINVKVSYNVYLQFIIGAHLSSLKQKLT